MERVVAGSVRLVVKLRTLTDAQFAEACARIDSGVAVRADRKDAAVHLLALLQEHAPGASVEVRVPPFAVAQCIAGSQHTRGTPPAVVEMDADTWIALARGHIDWDEARITASGNRSDLTAMMPLV